MSKAERERVAAHLNDFDALVSDLVKQIIAEVERDQVRNQINDIVFTPNNALPKRNDRPTKKSVYLTYHLYQAYDSSGEYLESLLQFVIANQEYYDIVDDIFDGDVAEGSEAEVFATKEFLRPVITRLITRLPDNIVEYWSRMAFRTVESFTDELLQEPNAEMYLQIVNKQSELYAVNTGLAAVISDQDDQTIQEAERIGELFFKFDQFLLDGYQADADDPDPWNAWYLMSEESALEQLRTWQRQLEKYLDTLPDAHSDLVRPLIAVDIEAWHRNL